MLFSFSIRKNSSLLSPKVGSDDDDVEREGGDDADEGKLVKDVLSCGHLVIFLPNVAMHSDSGHPDIRLLIMDHSLIRSLVRLLPTARFARALHCVHSFARSHVHSLRSSWERGFCLLNALISYNFKPLCIGCLFLIMVKKHKTSRLSCQVRPKWAISVFINIRCSRCQ